MLVLVPEKKMKKMKKMSYHHCHHHHNLVEGGRGADGGGELEGLSHHYCHICIYDVNNHCHHHCHMPFRGDRGVDGGGQLEGLSDGRQAERKHAVPPLHQAR